MCDVSLGFAVLVVGLTAIAVFSALLIWMFNKASIDRDEFDKDFKAHREKMEAKSKHFNEKFNGGARRTGHRLKLGN